MNKGESLTPRTGTPRTRDGNLAPLSGPLIAAVLKSAKQIHKQPSYSCAHHGTDNECRYVHNTPPPEELLSMPPSPLWASLTIHPYPHPPRPGDGNVTRLRRASERSRCWHSPPFRVGCERRGALQEASGGWDGFRCTKAIDRMQHCLPLSVQGDHYFRTAWAASHLSPRLNSRNRSTVEGEWFW